MARLPHRNRPRSHRANSQTPPRPRCCGRALAAANIHQMLFETGCVDDWQWSANMPGETELHKTLKKEACRWLYRMGYRCIAAEVRVPPLGIIDAVGSGVFRPYQNYLATPQDLPQVCFVECKASRADFLRDHSNDGQLHLCLMERDR